MTSGQPEPLKWSTGMSPFFTTNRHKGCSPETVRSQNMKNTTKAPSAVGSLIVVIGLGAAFLTGCDPGSQSGNLSETPSITNSTISSSTPEAKYAGVYLCHSPATTLRLEADKTGGMMINGNASEGTWTLTLDNDGHDIIEFKPNNAGPSRFAVLSDGSLEEKKYGYKFEKLPAR